jgi:predicted alpha/beta-fold hydrolase
VNDRTVAALHDLSFDRFVARAPWIGADLQTLRNTLRKAPTGLPGGTELTLPLGDGEALIGYLHRSVDAGAQPLAVLIHGLSGSADSDYVVATARHLLALGFPVLRLNLRGAGASQRTSTGRYHAGKSEDLAAVLRALPDPLTRHGLLLVGYSLGGNMLLKFLGEGTPGIAVRGAVSVSAPFDLAMTSRRILERRNWVYHRHLLTAIKQEALAPTAHLTAQERQAIAQVRSIYDFDEVFIAPRHGFAGAADYHEKCSARRFVGMIEVPTLVIHALDDPWIPPAAYETVDWTKLKPIKLVLTSSGGHVGFHDAASKTPWHDRAIGRFAGLFAATRP